jgi:hypothetical protein
MKTFLHCVMLTVSVVAAIVMGVIVGDYGAWYFAWAIGTIMIVLVSAAGGVLLDTQERTKSPGKP